MGNNLGDFVKKYRVAHDLSLREFGKLALTGSEPQQSLIDRTFRSPFFIYNTEVRDMSSYYLVTEYYIEIAKYDDGEWVDGGDIVEFTKFKI